MRLVLALLLSLLSPAFAQLSVPADPLANLKQPHPRLIALDEDIARIRELVKSDPLAGEIHSRLLREAGQLMRAPAVEYKIVGPRLLTQSRNCLARVYTLALLHRLHGDAKYLERALKELRAAAAFPDWNPSHFLDTAEMTHAFAIGYDWLYPALRPEERQWIRQAIVEKGIRPALPVYEQQGWWSKSRFNWNQVCNGGIGIGALAIAEEEPELARRVIGYAVRSLPLALASYAPDGGWAEGPGYWHYATRYTVYFLAALDSALGGDFGLSRLPGFARAGHFRIYSSGPSGQSFNYADAGASVGGAAEMFWLARKFSQPVYAWQQREILSRRSSADALDLVWFQTGARTPGEAGWPTGAVFQGVQAAFLNTAWEGDGRVFLGVKGGDNKANHGQLDLGTFVLDSGTVRWALDLGSDDYNLPAYFGKQRWNYYRLRTESHNTVLIDNENQDVKAEASISASSFQPEKSMVRIDLSGAYPDRLRRHERTLSLEPDGRLLIEDSIEASRPVEALWGMVTAAEVSLEGRRARLRQSGRTLTAEIHAPPDARFDTVSTMPPTLSALGAAETSAKAASAAPRAQNPNKGTRKLVVRLPGRITAVELKVSLTPARRAAMPGLRK